jgi:hypothetical protein
MIGSDVLRIRPPADRIPVGDPISGAGSRFNGPAHV